MVVKWFATAKVYVARLVGNNGRRSVTGPSSMAVGGVSLVKTNHGSEGVEATPLDDWGMAVDKLYRLGLSFYRGKLLLPQHRNMHALSMFSRRQSATLHVRKNKIVIITVQ